MRVRVEILVRWRPASRRSGRVERSAVGAFSLSRTKQVPAGILPSAAQRMTRHICLKHAETNCASQETTFVMNKHRTPERFSALPSSVWPRKQTLEPAPARSGCYAKVVPKRSLAMPTIELTKLQVTPNTSGCLVEGVHSHVTANTDACQ
ncbi:hypothetical protein TRVL_10015 [Trypanosoma vivax]|nr:hypothetical protein TRVL_10015 [Trypanosoma vivax]